MAAEWPPEKGQLWLTMDRWPATATEPEIPGGAMVVILGGDAREGFMGSWWKGVVLHGDRARWIRAVEGDIIPADDPRIQCISSLMMV